jgi:hypothetical protein
MLCRESLDIPLGQRPFTFSTINEDGMPFQYALTLAPGRPYPLQFLSEVGCSGSYVVDHAALSRERIDSLCRLLVAKEQEQQLRSLLNRMTPSPTFELETDHAGPFWIGMRFTPESQAQLLIYINGKWGNRAGCWNRAADFAACLGASEVWQEVAPVFTEGMEPLGFAISVASDRPITGRIYARSWGRPVAFFERVVQALHQPGAEKVLHQFVATMIDEERQTSIPSVVCSVGLKEKAKSDFKLELCAHCLFADDRQAAAHCIRWLESAKMEASPYHQLLDVIAPEGLQANGSGSLHSFVGFGWKDQELYSSIYLKPQMLASAG